MVKSILDSDLYKFTTSYAYMKKYPDASGTFSFVDRNNTIVSKEKFKLIYDAIKEMCKLKLSSEELEWCKQNIKFIPRYYWEWLSTFQFDIDKIDIWRDDKKKLHIQVYDKLYKATLYEVPLLAIVSEVMSTTQDVVFRWADIREKLLNKLELAHNVGFKFSEFGTRRRYSYDMQNFIMNVIANSNFANSCVGTSNVHLAMKFGLKPMGTHPHEWFMFHGAQFGYKHANYLALDAWQDIYQGDLGIALTDTFTSNVFFKNFDMKLAKLFDGIRQDSGNPYDFAEKAIARYKELGIDPKTKTIVFSDGLDFFKAYHIYEQLHDRIGCSFGIGTNLTNDVDNVIPSNIVMKLISCKMNDNQDSYGCVKLSDVEGKHIGTEGDIQHAIYELGLQMMCGN